MSDFLERLSHRSVRLTVSDAAVPPLEPRLPARFEALPVPTPEDEAADLVEEHVTVPARAATPARATPPPPPEVPVANVPPEADSDTAARKPARPRVVRSMSDPAAMPVPEVVPRPTEQGALAPPRPRTAADRTATAPDSSPKPADRKDVANPPQRPATTAPLELVVVERRTPALRPTAPAAPPTSQRAAGPPRAEPVAPPRHAATPHAEVPRPADRDRRTGLTPPATVDFEPREPLAAVGLEPLTGRELLAVPAIADVAAPDGVVHVHIGRLEVNRPAAPPPSAPSPRRRAPTLSLDDYLAQRTIGGGADRGRRP
jgi:hypothetical protein